MAGQVRSAVLRSHADATCLELRNGIWQYRRRVPSQLTQIDPRREIRISTGCRDRASAVIVASQLNEEVEAHWCLLLETAVQNGSIEGHAGRFDVALRVARRLGLTYRPANELASGPLAEVLARVEALEDRGQAGNVVMQSAVLGGAEKPELKLSDLFSTYEKLSQDRLFEKSEGQIRKWRNPRLKAIGNLIDLTGNKPISQLTRDDALDFRSWWLDRVRDEGYDQGSANKDIGYIASMMKVVDEAFRLKLSLPFAGLRIAGERHNPRVPYDPEFVRTRILPGHELESLNAEARAVVIMVAATGMRPSEVVGLIGERIVLDDAVPHVQVRPDGRQLKTEQSERDLPLVGRALEVMRDFPDGFARYRTSPDALSAVVNKGLTSAGLRPTSGHTLYSLRHTFKDRLIALEAPQRIQDALMGHAVKEVKYGAGPTLKHKAEWLTRVWG